VTLAELILLAGFLVVIYFLLRPFQTMLENMLEKLFSRPGKAKGWIIDADAQRDDKPRQE
jgi:hypothetical protein